MESLSLQEPNILCLPAVPLHEENSVPSFVTKNVSLECNHFFRPNFQFPGIWGINKLHENKMKMIRQIPKVGYLKGQLTISDKSVSCSGVGVEESRNSSRLKPHNQMQIDGSWVAPHLNKSLIKDIRDNWESLHIDELLNAMKASTFTFTKHSLHG